jgi:hypothetical protein
VEVRWSEIAVEVARRVVNLRVVNLRVEDLRVVDLRAVDLRAVDKGMEGNGGYGTEARERGSRPFQVEVGDSMRRSGGLAAMLQDFLASFRGRRHDELGAPEHSRDVEVEDTGRRQRVVEEVRIGMEMWS